MNHRCHFIPSASLPITLLLFTLACGSGVTSSSGGSTSTSGSTGTSTGTGTSGGTSGNGTSGGTSGTGTSGGSTGSGSGGTSGGGTSGSGGGSGSASSTVGYLYAIENPNAASIVEGFSIDSTGTLTPLTPTVSAGDNANDIVSDASGKFVFAGNSPGCCSNPFPKAPIQLISYAVGTSGSLTVANQQTFTNANDTVNGLLLDASGTDLYVSSMQVMIEGTISSFGVNSSTGELSSLGPDPTNTIMPGRMALHPNGRFLYAAEVLRHHYPDLGGFELFMRDPATGLVTDTHQTYPGSGRGADFYVDCGLALGGQYLLGQALDTNKITVWAVDAGTGALTVSSEIMGNFAGLTVDPSGAFAIATTTDGSVTSYKVSSTGTLTQASTAMAAVGVTHVVTDASGKFVYAESSTTNQIFGFAFDSSTGALTALSGSPFAASGMPIRMATIVSH